MIKKTIISAEDKKFIVQYDENVAKEIEKTYNINFEEELSKYLIQEDKKI